MIFRRLIAAWLLACVLMPSLAHAVDATATLDRSSVQLGETVTLNLRVTGSAVNGNAPDLSILEKDFEILGVAPYSSLVVDNGVATSTLTYGVALRPRQVGMLQIPVLSIEGHQTKPLWLQVTPSDQTAGAAAAVGQKVFMEAQVEPGQAYVGQQLGYVVRLYSVSHLNGDAPSAPQLNNVEVNQLGDGLNYSVQLAGRTYYVLEQRYALIPQRAGHFEIPAVNFHGVAIDPNDPNSFFGGGTPVSASAPALDIEVRAAPADWGGTAWLPARQLSLTLDGWPTTQNSARVGQPLNLTMRLAATGLSYEVLPALSLPPLDGATVYPDKPATGNRQDGQWINGWRQQAFAIVPERAGTLTVPATTLKWWNVLTDRMEVAQIPAHSITVLPAIGGAAAPPAVAAAVPATASADATHAATSAPVTPWRWIAVGSIGLWLLSVLAWWLWRRRAATVAVASTVPAPARVTARQSQLAFLAAARGRDTAAQVRSLLAWARAERPAIQHLGELAAALGDESQRQAIAVLQRRHYAGAPMSDDGPALAEAFRAGFVWRSADAADADTSLPPLYPFKLH